MFISQYSNQISIDRAFDGHIKIEGMKNVAFHVDDFFFAEVALALGKQAAYGGRVYLVIFASQ
jgi:hypothetical protein